MSAIGFDEIGYLTANPDLEQAVRHEEFASGFQHWQMHGKREGRSLKPAVATKLMVRSGAV